MRPADFVARRYRDVLLARGTFVVLHYATTLEGPDPAPNPPRSANLTARDEHPIGSTELRLVGEVLAGRIEAGDAFVVGYQRMTAAGMVKTAANSATVPLAAPLTDPLAAGAPVTPHWQGHRRVPAEVNGFSRHLIDGTLIDAADLSVTISNFGLPSEPKPGMAVIAPWGQRYVIRSAVPAYLRGAPVRWAIQAR